MEEKKDYVVFIVEDDDYYGQLLEYLFSLDPEVTTRRFSNGKDLLNALHQGPSAVTLDYRLPDATGEELLKKIREYDPDIDVVVISEQDNISTAVNLLKMGAFDYVEKSGDIQDRILTILRNLRTQKSLKKRIQTLNKEVEKKYSFSSTVIGNSEAMRKVFALMERSVQTNINVMIAGDTGTGKEVIAKAIHFNSERKKKPFVAVNVAAIPTELVESELFGHEKGAFTGALNRRIGKFEEAEGGTLFLDEIAEMDMAMQAKLLRALQEREVVRLGSNTPVSFNCRIIIATHKDLMKEVEEGRFREDLYYRLLGLRIYLPALRERGSDILLLAKHFADAFCKENGMDALEFTPEAREKLLSHPFPGNVRELKSIVDLACVMAHGGAIQAEDLQMLHNPKGGDILAREMSLRDYNLHIVKTFLDRYEGKVKTVADKLDVGQATIYRMMKEMEEVGMTV